MDTRVNHLKVSVAEILNRPGEQRSASVREVLSDVQTSLARLGDNPVVADLRLESVMEGILVTGAVGATASLACARCLERFDEDVDLQVCELFVAPGHDADEDAYRIEGLEIDLEPMLRDAIALSLPLNPLCRDDCAGLCAHCGRDLNAGPCDCTTDETDPRWAPLEALRSRLDP